MSGRGEGHAVVRADASGEAALFIYVVKGRKSKSFTGRFKGFTEEEIARGMICDGQRVTVFFVAEQELTFVVGAPQLVGLLPQRQGRALRMIASAPSALDQAVALVLGGQRLQTVFLVAVKYFVTGFARDGELATERDHFLPVQQASHKTNTFIHNRTLLPRHRFLP